MQASSVQSVLVLAFSLGLIYIVQSYLNFRKAVNSIQNLPGYRTLLSPVNAVLLPAFPGVAPGGDHVWRKKHSVFEKWGWDIISAVSGWPSTTTILYLADASAINEVMMSRARFPKPVERYGVLSLFGRNIVASEGEEWKRYRKIAAPAFSDRNNRLVWDETIKIMLDMFQILWGNRDTIVVDHAVDITLPITLFVIGVAGFGRKLSWEDDHTIPSRHKMSFKDALHVVSTNAFFKLLLPSWVFGLGLTEWSKTIQLAFVELEQYMTEMILTRKASTEGGERWDLFAGLLDANETDGEVKLTDSELMGNIFIFLLAGHETAAHTLCFAFGLLALYQDEQEILFQHIKTIIPDGDIPAYEMMPLLTQSLAVLYETLRLFPTTPEIPKYAAEDTILIASNANGEKRAIPVLKGTNLIFHVPALHYNPRYWSDPHSFKPSRFLGDWPRDAFLPFSAGARACLGRKFGETEIIAVLTMLVSRYKIQVKEEPQFTAETFEERKARVLAARPGLTLTPIRLPLVFTRR